MRKKYLVIVLLVFCSWMAFSNNDPGTFTIKAYKIGESDYLNIFITDAISNSLNVANGGKIIINDELNQLMGQVNNPEKEMSSFSDHVIFSYRVAGNTEASYSLTLTFQRMELSENGVEINDNTKIIQCAYETGNITYIFSENGKNTIDNTYSIGANGEQNDSRIVIPSTYSYLDSTTGYFKNSWTVKGSGKEWIVRGAVAVDIGPTSYGAAIPGEYNAKVQVKLEVL